MMRTRCRAVLLESFIDSWKGGRPSRLVLDIDSADDEVRGRQEGGFYHGCYNHYCFLPLYITCGGRPLFALLRPGNADPAGGVTGPLGRIVERLRQRWPGLEILLRADSSYARRGTILASQLPIEHSVFQPGHEHERAGGRARGGCEGEG